MIEAINPFGNISPTQISGPIATNSIRNNPEVVTKEFMSFFLTEILKNSYNPASGFETLLNDNYKIPNSASTYDELLVQQLAQQLVESKAFGFDGYFPSDIVKYRKDLLERWQP